MQGLKQAQIDLPAAARQIISEINYQLKSFLLFMFIFSVILKEPITCLQATRNHPTNQRSFATLVPGPPSIPLHAISAHNPNSLQLLLHREEHERHQRRLTQAKSFMQIEAPQEFPHLKTRAKQHQIQEDRYLEIARTNKLLLIKILTTLKNQGSSKDEGEGFMSHRKSSRKRNKSLSSRSVIEPDDCLRLSLNKDIRRREMDKVDLENQGIAERIISSKSTFDVEKWKREYKQQKKVQKIMGRKPDPERIKQFIERGMQRRMSVPSIPATMDNSIGDITPMTFGQSNNTGGTSQRELRESLTKMKKSLKKFVKLPTVDTQDSQYQSSRVIDGVHLYSLSIYLTSNMQIFIKATKAIDETKTYSLHMGPALTQRIFHEEFQASFEKLADHLTFSKDGTRLVLKLPAALKELMKVTPDKDKTKIKRANYLCMAFEKAKYNR